MEKEKKPLWELYDIEKDRSELNDLSSKHPENARELKDLWEKEAERTYIYPLPGKRKKQAGRFKSGMKIPTDP